VVVVFFSFLGEVAYVSLAVDAVFWGVDAGPLVEEGSDVSLAAAVVVF
jgi:hypothetical protein